MLDKNKRRGLRGLLAAIVAAATLGTGGAVANAAQITHPDLPGYTFNNASEGSWHSEGGSDLGPVARNADGTWAYCTQAGVPTGNPTEEWTEATGQDERIAAWLAHDNTAADDLTQGAVAYAIHEHLDAQSGHAANSHWTALKTAGLRNGDINTVAAKAKELWDKAAAKTVSGAVGKPEVKYTSGQRKGTVTAQITSSAGGYLSGVPYRVMYDRSMIQVDNASGTTTGQPITINRTALKTGTTKIHVAYDLMAARRLVPKDPDTQTRFAEMKDPTSSSTPEVSFKVVRGMKVTLASDTTRNYAKGLNVNDVIQAEKGDELTDTIRVNAVDLGGDGKDTGKDGLNHDQDDWLTGTDGKRVPITVNADVYGPYTDAQADKYRKTPGGVPADARRIGTATITASDSGDYTVSTKDGTLKLEDKLTTKTLSLGHYTFVWRAINKEQANIKQLTGSDIQEESRAGAGDGYPLLSDTREGFFASREEVETHNMRPTVTSSTATANKDAKETVTGNDGKQRPAIQTADGITYREKDAPIRDTVTVNVLDSNGDGKIDTYDWLHTAKARQAGDYSEATQAPITVEGELVGTIGHDEYQKQMNRTATGETVTTLPKGMKTLATVTFDVTRAGDYLVSNEASDKPKAQWKAAKGVDLKNLPGGYQTIRWRIVNGHQTNLSKATGIDIKDGTDNTDGYPFDQDADDGYFAADETLYTRIRFDLDSQASFNRVKLGQTTGDRLIIRKTNADDLWPTYYRKPVVEGETGSLDKVKLDFHGYLYKLSDDPEAKVKTLDAKPADLKPIHETRINGVTDWGSYDTGSYTYNEKGTYAWYWELDPDLTSANHLTDEAWRKISHRLDNHVFGLASEIVRVGEKETSCKVSTKAQGVVTATNDRADLHDTAYIACEKAATIEFELWKQGNGDTGTDVLVTTTAKQDATGKTEATSQTVTQQVKDGDRFYWREITRDGQGNVLSYGKARDNAETVRIENKKTAPSTPLARTGLTAGILIPSILLTALAGLGIAAVRNRRRV